MNPIILLGVFEIKHFLADFLLQTDSHTGKFKKEGWILPLADHCAIHGIMTLLIILAVKPWLWYLCLVDFAAHFITDRIKASPDLLGRFKALSGREYVIFKGMTDHHNEGIRRAARESVRSNIYFWYVLGLDQLVHQLTGLFIVWLLTQ